MGRLTATVVPAQDFQRYRWMLPIDVPHTSTWYYGWRLNEPSSGVANVDPATVDPMLRPLVGWLHARGVRTTPSCQGHFGGCPNRIRQAAADLAAQERAIRARGLWMRDVERGDAMLVRDPTWRAPTLPGLVEGVAREEGNGYLGVLLPHKLLTPRDERRGYAAISPRQTHDGTWLDATVRAPSERQQAAAWGWVEGQIMNAIRGTDKPWP